MKWLAVIFAFAVVSGCGTTASRSPNPSAAPVGSSATASASKTPGPAIAEPVQTPPPGVPGQYALEFHLKLVGSVDSNNRFEVAFHSPTSDPGYEAVFTLCPADNPGGGAASGPCGPGKTFVEGGGFQPSGSSISYRFSRTTAGATQTIAQGTMTLNTNTALVVSYPTGG